MESKKLTRKEVYEIAAGRPVIKAGYEKVAPLLRELEKQGDAIKIGSTAGVYGWNADVWAVGPVMVVEGRRPFGQITLTGYHKKVLEKEGARASLADALGGAFCELKDWGAALPAPAKGWRIVYDYQKILYRDLICAKIKQGKGARIERKIRPIRQVGHVYSHDRTIEVMMAAHSLGLNVEKGNDAPRGGRLGNYITVRNF